MPVRSLQLRVLDVALKQLYGKAVANRGGGRVPGPSPTQVAWVSDRLGDSRLAVLFIESAFAAMPENWCREKFQRTYPPANVVFGKNGWDRYQEYIANGSRVPVVESK